jgi:hypothetical protein
MAPLRRIIEIAIILSSASTAHATDWWGSFGIGDARLNLTASPTLAAQSANGLTVELIGGVVIDRHWLLGLEAATVIVQTTFCGQLCTPEQTYRNREFDRYYLVARYHPQMGYGGWFVHGATGLAVYQDAHVNAPASSTQTVALQRQGHGWGAEIGAGYEFRRKRPDARSGLSVLASYGHGRIASDFAAAGDYRFDIAMLTVAVVFH